MSESLSECRITARDAQMQRPSRWYGTGLLSERGRPVVLARAFGPHATLSHLRQDALGRSIT